MGMGMEMEKGDEDGVPVVCVCVCHTDLTEESSLISKLFANIVNLVFELFW